MNRKRNRHLSWAWLALTIIPALPCAAAAAEQKQMQTGSLPFNRRLGVDFYFQDVTAVTPSQGAPIDPVDGSVLGLGVLYRQQFKASAGWFWDGEFGYGWGNQKQQWSGPGPFTAKVNFKSWYAMGGIGYEWPITPKVGIYGLGDLLYSSTMGTFSGNVTSVDGSSYAGIGLSKAFGFEYGAAPNWNLFGEMYTTYNWLSATDGNAKYSATHKFGCYRGGILFKL